jgi:hypothetical protein
MTTTAVSLRRVLAGLTLVLAMGALFATSASGQRPRSPGLPAFLAHQGADRRAGDFASSKTWAEGWNTGACWRNSRTTMTCNASVHGRAAPVCGTCTSELRNVLLTIRVRAVSYFPYTQAGIINAQG